MNTIWMLIIGLTSIFSQVNGSRDRYSYRTCEEITVPMCQGIGYNKTYMPNSFHHDNQEEAGLEVHQFWPLVEIQCSPDLKFFLCSMYTPICIDTYDKPLPACKNVCERARSGCAPLMKQYGFAWPEKMNCELLPEYGNPENLCMDFNTTTTTTPTTMIPVKPSYPPNKLSRTKSNTITPNKAAPLDGKLRSLLILHHGNCMTDITPTINTQDYSKF